MKSPQLLALESAERFVREELETRTSSYMPNPTEAEQRDLFDAQNVLAIIQHALLAAPTKEKL